MEMEEEGRSGKMRKEEERGETSRFLRPLFLSSAFVWKLRSKLFFGLCRPGMVMGY